MIRTTLFAGGISLGFGGNLAFADSRPDLGHPFVDRDSQHSPMATGGPVLSATDARARLRADGYRAISDLSQGRDGAWRGTAIRGAAKLQITVDPQGRIIAQ